MERPPIRDLRLIEALEACRPGSEDLSDPELEFLHAELAARPDLDDAYESLQRVDAALGQAFRRVEVPSGLADRLLERLAEARQGDAASEESPPAPAEPVSPPIPVKLTRRHWTYYVAGLTTLTAAASLLAAVLWQRPERALTASEIQTLAMNRFAADLESSPSAELIARTAPPSDFPFSPSVYRNRGAAWRQVPDFVGGRSAIAYDLTSPGGTRATLYVVAYPLSDAPSVPPSRPANTQGRSVGLWQSGGNLYLLVVAGDERIYRSFLAPARGPLA